MHGEALQSLNYAEEIRAGAMKEGKLTEVSISSEQRKAYADDARKIHTWWIDKSKNGQEIYDTMKTVLDDIDG